MAINIAQRLVQPPSGYVPPSNIGYVPYPKWVYFTDGRPAVVVQNKEEHDAVLGGGQAKPAEAAAIMPAPVATLVGTNDEKTMLLKIAADKGIRIDGRWKLPKIRKAIEAATAR